MNRIVRKLQAIDIISRAAIIYDKKMNQRNLLIIFGSPVKPDFIETQSLQKNFLHLTGVELNQTIDDNTAERFFAKAINHKINENDFEFKDDNTELKLNILIQTLNVASNAKMIGDYNYNGNHINLQTDKLAGGVNACLGLIKVGDYYVPNTVLATDIRKETDNRQKVLTVLSKKIIDEKYNTIEMVGKKIDIKRLLEKISPLVKIDSDIIDKQNKYIMNKLYTDFLKQHSELPPKLDSAENRAAVSEYINTQLNYGNITESQRESLENLRQAIWDFEEPLFIQEAEKITEWCEEAQEKAAERLAERESQNYKR